MKIQPKSKAHEKHPIHGMPFSFSRITAYKTTSITLTGYKQLYMRLKSSSCIYYQYEAYLSNYTIKNEKPKLGF